MARVTPTIPHGKPSTECARPIRKMYRQRCLADPGLPVLQHPARGRRGRLDPARESPVGHPTHPPHHRPRPDRVHRPTARPAFADRLALGAGLGRPLGHRDHPLTDTRPPKPRGNTHRGRTGQMPTWARLSAANAAGITRQVSLREPRRRRGRPQSGLLLRNGPCGTPGVCEVSLRTSFAVGGFPLAEHCSGRPQQRR